MAYPSPMGPDGGAGPPALPAELLRSLAPLRERLHTGPGNSVVPFVGSGLSQGLATWRELLNRLIEQVPEAEQGEFRDALDAGKYVDLAQELHDHPAVRIAGVREAISRAYRTVDPPPALFAKVVALPTRHFLTTNYDPWLKTAVSQRYGSVPAILVPSDGATLGHLGDLDAWVFHLHGEAQKPETCVLTARDYRRLLSGDPRWREALGTLLRSRHLLFLGSSLSEPHLEVLLGDFEEVYQPEGGIRRHWWLGRPAGRLDRGRLERLGMQVIDYEDHARLPMILDWLASPAGEGPAVNGRLLNPSPGPGSEPGQGPFFVPHPSKGAGLVGRDAALGQVRTALVAGRATVIGQVAAFTGIGGIGKTQLAVEYCHAHRSDYPGGVFWFTADQDIDSQVLRLADEAGWVHPAAEHAHKLQVARQRLKQAQQAIFVYDNLECPVPLRDLDPTPGRGNHLLLTSRVEQPGLQRVDVELLDGETALRLLANEAGRDPQGAAEDAAARTLCERLDGLPLALELAGAFLQRRPSHGFAEYLDRLGRRGIEYTATTEGYFERRSTTGHSANIADALRVSGPLLDEHPGLDLALDVLAWSASATMSWDLLRHLVEPEDPDRLRDGIDLAATLHVLRHEGAHVGDTGPRFRMHRLVQDVRRTERPLLQLQADAAAVLARLTRWFEARRKDYKDLAAFEAELDHLVAWAAHAEALAVPVERVRIQWLLAYPAHHRGAYRRSFDLLQRARSAFDDGKLVEPLLLANLLEDLGVNQGRLGMGEKADLARQALQIRRQVQGAKHPETLVALALFADGLRQQQELDEAASLLRDALATALPELGESHLTTALIRDYLGHVLLDMDDVNGALDEYQRALTGRKPLVAEDNPLNAGSAVNIANCLLRAGRRLEALRVAEAGQALAHRVLGPSHPHAQMCTLVLAHCLRDLGDRRRAFEEVRSLLGHLQADSPIQATVIQLHNRCLPTGFRPLPTKADKPTRPRRR